MSEKEKSFRFIIPVDEIPIGRRDKALVYTQVLKEFLDSNLKYAEVNLPDKKTVTVQLALKRHLKREGITNVRVRFINKKVYLERKD